jgi:hypothetical protein
MFLSYFIVIRVEGGSMNQKTTSKTKRGFGSPNFDPALKHAILSHAGEMSHKRGNAHEWTSEEARIHGRKGGAKRKYEFKTKGGNKI